MISQKKNYLPKGWVRTQIGEIFDVFSGYGFPKKYQGNKKGDLAFLKVGDISRYVQSGNIYVEKADNYVSYEVSKKIKAKPFPKYTVVFAKIGEALKLDRRAILGKDAIVDNNVMGISETRGVISALFLYYFMNTIKLENLSRATTVPSIRKSDVEMLSFPLPPLNEQNRIVAKIEKLFTKLDAGVAALKQVQAQLKRYRQSVLKTAVEGRLTAEWREQHKDELEPANILLERILKEHRERWEIELLAKYKSKNKKPLKKWKDKYRIPAFIDTTGMPELPEGWVYGKLEDLIYIAGRIGWRGLKAEEYTSGGPLFLSVHNLNLGRNVDFSNAYHISVERYNESPEIQLQNDDILLVKDGAGIGKIGIVKGLKEKATVNSSLLVIRSGNIFIPEYLFYFLMGPEMQSVVRQRITGSATPHLFQRDIKQFILQFPPIEEQKKIVDEIERSLSVIEGTESVIKSELKRARILRQSILKRAFEGKLVPQDPNDDPASVLLDRIMKEKAKSKMIKQLEMF